MALYQNPPPQPFIGGAQPLAPREFTPPSGVVAANPPRRTLPETVLAAWRIEQWPQQQYRKLVQAAIAAAVQPPRRTLPETILAAWRVASQTPILSGWQIQEYVPDNPPFGLDAWLTSTLAQWQITPQPQQRTARLIQEAIAAAAANPSFDQAWLYSILSQWQAPTPVTQQRKLSPGIPGQSVDNPPNRAADLRAALISWIAPQPAQTFRAKFTQGIDNPPFGLPQRWRWDAPSTPAQVQYARFIQQAVVAGADDPPFGLRRYLDTINQWQARSVTPIISGWQIQEFIPSDNPPFGMPPDWLYSVLTAAWKPGDPLPKQLQKILQGAPPPPVNDPPFGMPPHWLYVVLNLAWKPGDPLPKQLMKILQEGPPPPDVLTYRKIITLAQDRIDVILG